VVSSRLEGGANVVSEAIVLGVPVLASRIPGNVGLLGRGYAGYYPTGDERALARLMHRTETDAIFFRGLQTLVKQRQRLFRPTLELRAWERLLQEVH
jgi:glycosyltransferase involved in cell wall biosynthesis